VTRSDQVQRRIDDMLAGRVERLVALVGDEIVADGALELVGHGSPDGSDGAIHEELHGITTAATIVESVVVTVGGEPRP